MEIHLLQSLIAEGRYEVDSHLVAEAIVDRLGLGRPPENPVFGGLGAEVVSTTGPPGIVGTRRPAQLQFDPRVVPPPHR